MRIERPKWTASLLLGGLVLLLAVPARGAVVPAAGASASATLAFCERLEPVIEAVTDGKPGRVAAAAARANAWWRAHGADSLYAAPMASLRAAAGSYRAPLAAAAAVRVSTLALNRCAEPSDAGVLVMRV